MRTSTGTSGISTSANSGQRFCRAQLLLQVRPQAAGHVGVGAGVARRGLHLHLGHA